MPVTTPPGTPPRTPPRPTHRPHLIRGSTNLVRDGFPNFPRPLTDDEDNNLNRLFMHNDPNESLIHNNNNVGVEITPPTGADTVGGLRRCKGTKRKGTKRKGTKRKGITSKKMNKKNTYKKKKNNFFL